MEIGGSAPNEGDQLRPPAAIWGLVCGADQWVANRLAVLGSELGVQWVDEIDRGADSSDTAPVAVVINLAQEDAITTVGSLRSQWPETVLVGYLGVPDQKLWVQGQRAGCDLVVNRGALVTRLRTRMAQATSGGARRFPLIDHAEVAGRLGLVQRISETPVGPVGLYQVDGRLYVAADRCPHAGATLSEGELDRSVVTCPRHGSQFDVCTGERLRGPADTDISVYPVVVSEGQVFLVAEPQG